MKKQTNNIKYVWGVLCQSSVVDQQSNNISLQNVLEQLQVNIPESELQRLKAQHPGTGGGITVTFPMQIVMLWRSINPKILPQAEVEVELFDGIGDSMQKMPFSFGFESGKGRMRTFINMQGVKVSDSGLYLFKVRIKETGNDTFAEVGEIPLEVNITKNT